MFATVERSEAEGVFGLVFGTVTAYNTNCMSVSVRRCWKVAMPVLLALVFASPIFAKPIRLRTGTIDPANERRFRPAVTEARHNGLFLIQFRRALDSEERAALKTLGADLLRYVPEDTYVAHLDKQNAEAIRALPFVEWVGDYLPEHKLHERVRGNLQRNAPGEILSVSVLLRARTPANEKRQNQASFQSLQQTAELPFGTILRGRITPARLAALANNPAVLWIEPGPEFKLVDELAAEIIAGDGGPNVTLVQAYGFDGRGVNVAVADSGLHNGDAASMHPDLFGRVTAFFHYGTLTDAADEHSHGTHVAGIVAGNGAVGEADEFGTLYGLGVAPGARIIAQRIFDGLGNYEAPPSFETLTRDALRSGADIGSNSWGDDTQGRYDLSAAEFDALVRDADGLEPGDQPYILEFSAGNAGPGAQTIGSPAVAKNVIATGASQNNRAEFVIYAEGQETMADFSSRGPCEDGRIKPDVVAPGTWIASLQSGSAGDENAWATISGYYMYQGGTSQAGPHVSGAAAVLVQYLRETYGMPRPSPALIKAILINSAIDMDDEVETDPAPNMDEGWGRIDLTEVIGATRRFEFLDQTTALVTSQVFERRVVVASSLEPFKVTLTYTDVPGFPGALPALVNDLDLEVIAPNGMVFRGNQFSQGESVPNATTDSINNVEGVHLFEPATGEYTVRVRARRVNDDARRDTPAVDQDFALVISGDLPTPGVGVLLMDRPAYTAPGTIQLRLFDTDLAGAQSATVQISSSTEPTRRDVVLLRANSGSFTGSVQTAAGPATADNVLQIQHGNLIEAIYNDTSAGARIATARADLVPPVLGNVNVTNQFGRTVIQWVSNERANSVVRFGTNATTLTLAITNSAYDTEHEVELSGLRPGQTYYFVVVSSDEAGNVTVLNNGGSPFTFAAVGAAPVLLVDAYEDDEDPETIELPRSGYTNPLDQAGVRYEVWDVSLRGTPTLNDLRAFQVVIWRISDSPYMSTSLTAQEQGLLQDYLNQGGGLFISSMELLSRLGDVPFRRNVLQVQQFLLNPDPFSTCTDCDEDFTVPTIRGAAGDPITSGVLADLDYSAHPVLDFGFFVFGPDFSDTFTPTTNATAILLEHSSGKPCGIRYPRTGQDASGRVVYLSFPIDAVPENLGAPNSRAALLRSLLQFLAPGMGGSGTIAFDRSEYTLPDAVMVEVGDGDLAGAGQLTVELYSQTFSNKVALTVRETTRPGLFRGTVLLARETDPADPAKVRARSGDLIYAEYVDASGPQRLQATARIDTLPPDIFGLAVEPEYEGALLFWETSELTDALVQYGESALLGRTAYNGEFSDWHEVRLSGLSPDRTYYYRVVSRDTAGNVTVDDNNGQLYTFQTLTPIRAPWQDQFEAGTDGWTSFETEDTQSRWTLGTPNNGVETSAYSPVNAWGSNLDGAIIDYAETFLISPAIDLTGGNQAILRFFHSYDFTAQNEFDIIEGGQLLIITNSVTAPVVLREYIDLNFGWEEEEVDLSAYAGRVIFLVWSYQLLSFEAAPRAGWLIDDVSVSLNTIVPSVVRVTNNLSQATFVLTGPSVTRNGHGISSTFSNLPPGQYTVTFGQVPFYQPPTAQTGSVAAGALIALGGNYSFADANSNGMSDAWEQQNFGTVSPTRTRSTDTDGDGAPDYEEFVSGSNPNGAGSYLTVATPEIVGPNLRLTWASVPGRSYRVEGSLDGFSWGPVTDWARASATFTSATLPTQPPPTPFLFRVEVRP